MLLSLCVKAHKDPSQLLEMYKYVDKVPNVVISLCVGSQRPPPTAGDVQTRGRGA